MAANLSSLNPKPNFTFGCSMASTTLQQNFYSLNPITIQVPHSIDLNQITSGQKPQILKSTFFFIIYSS